MMGEGSGRPRFRARLETRGGGPRASAPRDKASWLRELEARLNADESAFVRCAVAKMRPAMLERLTRLSVDDAVAALRVEMRGPFGPPPLTTRKAGP